MSASPGAATRTPAPARAKQASKTPKRKTASGRPRRATTTAKPAPKPAAPEQDVVFAPNPGPQTKLLESMARECGYGGAAGGGKSMGIVAVPLRWIHHPDFRGLILRREIPQLRDLVDKTRKLYKRFGGVYNGTTHTWTFPSGATIWLNHCQNTDDWEQYQGQEFHFIAFDELTTFTLRQFVEISTRLRGVSPGLPRIVRWTSNPGGKGHAWVFERYAPWLDPACKVANLPPRFDAEGKQLPPAAPGQVLWVTRDGDVDTFHAWPVDDSQSRQFIPALLSDNPKLTAEDPNYARSLKEHDPVRRAQLERGDWLVKAAAGLLFKRGWFHHVVGIPKVKIRWVRYWDRAATVDGDWTVGLLVGLLPDSSYLIADCVRMRGTPGAVQTTILETTIDDGSKVTQVFEQDPGQAGVVEKDALSKLLKGHVFRFVKPVGTKVERAGPASAQVEAGNVYILSHGGVRPRWWAPFRDELEGFPDADHDDQADALSGAINYLASKRAGPLPKDIGVVGDDRRVLAGFAE